MKPVKFRPEEAEKVDLETKIIYKYPFPTRTMGIARMVINGRHPEGEKFAIERDCSFVICVLKGKGTVYAGEERFEAEAGDVIFVPKENRFAVEGNLEYVTVDAPAWYMEQHEEVE